ncbi:MAG: ADP-ribosylglycohydrolase family protein [Wohlfahrtiimonas sp.]
MNNVTGLFLGTAVGDAMGLPRENLSPKRSVKLFGTTIQPALIIIPKLTRFSVCSDDTEHLWITADALIRSQGSSELFSQYLLQNMKKWFLSFPVGAGKASLKASMKLLIGISPSRSGVYSAGNGPAMRAPIIGAFFANDSEKLDQFLKISTMMTHTDPQAEEGAWVIAQVAALIMRENPKIAPIEKFFNIVLPKIHSEQLKKALQLARDYLIAKQSFEEYLIAMKLDKRGVSGYIGHTVPVVIYAWLYYFGDYQKGIEAIILAGGDSDTTAAILGALMGISIDSSKDIPKEWLDGIHNAPMSVNKLVQMSEAISDQNIAKIPQISWGLQLFKNIGLLAIVLLHGFRRLLAPY